MIQLTEGIYLEDAKQTLKWGCSRDQAWLTGKPTRARSDDDLGLHWKATILAGQECIISAYLPGDARLEQVMIVAQGKPEVYLGACQLMHYCKFFEHLLGQIGAPQMRSGRGSFLAPILTWKHDSCLLELVTGFGMSDATILWITRGDNPRFPD